MILLHGCNFLKIVGAPRKIRQCQRTALRCVSVVITGTVRIFNVICFICNYIIALVFQRLVFCRIRIEFKYSFAKIACFVGVGILVDFIPVLIQEPFMQGNLTAFRLVLYKIIFLVYQVRKDTTVLIRISIHILQRQIHFICLRSCDFEVDFQIRTVIERLIARFCCGLFQYISARFGNGKFDFAALRRNSGNKVPHTRSAKTVCLIKRKFRRCIQSFLRIKTVYFSET